jgi:hypothetical protein
MIKIKPVSLQFDIIAISYETRGRVGIDYAPDHAFLCHLKDVLGGLEGQLPFKFDTYSIEYMYSEIISTDVVENRDILGALHRTTSSIASDMGWSN